MSPAGGAGLAVQSARRGVVELLFEGFEDGSVAEYTFTGDTDGQNYHFAAQTVDPFTGAYAGEQYLEGYGGGAVREERLTVGEQVAAPVVSWAFKQYHTTDANTGYAASAALHVECNLTDGTTAELSYHYGSVLPSNTNSATEDPAALVFVVDGRANSAWTTVERDIDADLAAGGYASAAEVVSITWRMTAPGTGGGSDELGVRVDDLTLTT